MLEQLHVEHVERVALLGIGVDQWEVLRCSVIEQFDAVVVEASQGLLLTVR